MTDPQNREDIEPDKCQECKDGIIWWYYRGELTPEKCETCKGDGYIDTEETDRENYIDLLINERRENG